MKIFLLALATLIFFSGCTNTSTPPLPTVEKIDLERYSGKWIEIARYENHFEIGCAGATAEYLRNDDHIRVINSCYDAQGVKSAEAIGRAYAVKGSRNAKLEVSFFRPFYGDYWVVMLGNEYQYSVVGDPKRKYLWILSRTSKLKEEDKQKIFSYLPTIGYDPAKLYWTTVRP
ncbi:MAG: lipocalin family protein [Sulfuricurvum sp.]|nr:lipocalin family protein [Sulfuricurvum sp.]